MATGTVLSVAQTLFAAIQCMELRELCSKFKYESQLEALRGTVETIQNVLLDAESKQQELNHQGLYWLDKLKDAVYDADDLFDEFATIAERQKRMPGGKISKKVQAFFSSENQLLFAVRTSIKIKEIREKLDSIATDRAKFGFSDVYRPVKRREETWSYVHEHSIIGRDSDKEAIIGMLMRESDSSVDNVSFLSIVGMGGLGKTALAQLVYNDDRIKGAFELKLWVCVSDDFSIEDILRKMLKSAADQGTGDLGIDGLQINIRRHIGGIKYFLILDDLWNESRDNWLKLREFLQVGARGSRVVVTTRSQKVVEAIGDDPMYTLIGLSDSDSWLLFEKMAFQGNKEVDDDLVCIGKDIVKKCANVPLAIRVVGSMLYGHHKSKWRLFQRIELPEMGLGEESIMPVLNFSYQHLTPQLKSCFSYCALFPKDYLIQKKLLICLWSTLGNLKPLSDMQSIEDVAEDYFSILLNRCFFQDIEKMNGEIYSCKMHDLIHDLAQEVAGKESYLMLQTSKSPFEGKTRHLSVSVWHPLLLSPGDALGKLRGLRTFFRPSNRQLVCKSEVTTLLAKCRRLRVLDLHKLSLKALPSTIKNLLHLRYLDLSENKELRTLPESITKLYNLQVLNLRFCLNLEELPKDLRELVNLRHLDITYCYGLTHMPAGMDNMSRLCTLTWFVLGPESSKKSQSGQLRDLMPLIHLRGTLEIIFKKGYAHDSTSPEEGAYLLNKEHIKALTIKEDGMWRHREPSFVDERLLERLEPHCDLREMNIDGYKGMTLPRWAATLEISLPRLVRITLEHFPDLQHLPALSQLHHLKNLALRDMPNVELKENDNGGAVVPPFPSLEYLVLDNCPSLKSFPECPHVKSFRLCGLNEALKFCKQRDDAAAAMAPNNNNSAGDVFDLQSLKVDDLGLVKSLFGDSLKSIRELTLGKMEVESLMNVVDEYEKYACSIISLKFDNCLTLKSLSGGGIEHLTNLKTLDIWNCPNLELEEEKGFPWKDLHALSDLSLGELPQLIDLPRGIQYLTSLQSLGIEVCKNLETFPEWPDSPNSLRSLKITSSPKLKSLPEAILPSLTSLRVYQCDRLQTRYSAPNGEDYSKISHIPRLHFSFFRKMPQLVFPVEEVLM